MYIILNCRHIILYCIINIIANVCIIFISDTSYSIYCYQLLINSYSLMSILTYLPLCQSRFILQSFNSVPFFYIICPYRFYAVSYYCAVINCLSMHLVLILPVLVLQLYFLCLSIYISRTLGWHIYITYMCIRRTTFYIKYVKDESSSLFHSAFIFQLEVLI